MQPLYFHKIYVEYFKIDEHSVKNRIKETGLQQEIGNGQCEW